MRLLHRLWPFLLATPLLADDGSPANFPERVRQALVRGRDWVAARQQPDGAFPSNYTAPGSSALVLWALLESGLPTQDATVQKTLAYVRAKGDPNLEFLEHANYTGALTLVALQSYYFQLAHEEETSGTSAELAAAARRRVTAADRALAERCLRYVRSCSTENNWQYNAARTAPVNLVDAGVPRATPPFAPVQGPARNDPTGMPWGGDNSNAQYGWMGIRAATLLGIGLDEKTFFTDELERMLRTRREGTGYALALTRRGTGGFGGLWPAKEVHENVTRCGWGYSVGKPIPTMTTGCVSSLIYAWQEAEERGLMTDALRTRVHKAILGGLADLIGATKESVAEG